MSTATAPAAGSPGSASANGSAGPARPAGSPAGRPPARRRQPPPVEPFVSLLGALSVLAGGAALFTTVSGTSWIGPTVQIVGLVWLIGLGCRLLRFPAPVTVLAQAAGMVLTLTAVFTSGGYGGIIPNARAAREAEALLTGAWDQILRSTVPAPASPELGFLIAVALGLIALIVDFFVSEVDTPALVALPLLCLYSVPASIAEQLLPWWTFALPAGGYALLVAVAGHPGRRVGLRAGLGVATAGGLAVTIAITASLVLADSITDVGTAGRIDRSDQPGTGADIGLSVFANLHGDLQQREARDVLRVTGLPGPDYLRTTALEAWNATQGFSLVDPNQGAQPAGSPVTVQPLARNPEAEPARITVQVLDFADRFVPIYQGTMTITGLDDDYTYNPELGSVFRDESTSPRDYQLEVSYGQIRPDLLRADTVTARPNLISADGVPAGAAELARSIVAGSPTVFDQALAMKNYFTDPSSGFVYSLQVPTGNSGDLLTDFLLNKQGYCEQYAAAMAVMLRSVGIPSRVAIGFTQGRQNGPQDFTITSHNAHAWVEVLFDKAGWVRFDPTPLSPAIGGNQGYQADSPTPASATATGETTADPTDQGSAGSTSRATLTDFETVTVAGGQSGSSTTPFWKPWYTWTLGVLLGVAALVALPSLWRRRRAAHRLAAAGGGGSAAAAAAWAEIEDLAVDHGLSSGRGGTVRKAANQLARDGKLTEGARAGLRRIALGTESAWYSAAGYTPAEGTDLAADVRRIGVDLEHSAPRSWWTRLLPRSLFARE